jgi:hypothetical protein
MSQGQIVHHYMLTITLLLFWSLGTLFPHGYNIEQRKENVFVLYEICTLG